MRKRNISILFRLTRKEAEALERQVRESGLSREAYLRHLIKGELPRAAPPQEYYSMMEELHQIGNSLNQLLRMSRDSDPEAAERYDRDMRKFEKAVRLITEAVILPDRSVM